MCYFMELYCYCQSCKLLLLVYADLRGLHINMITFFIVYNCNFDMLPFLNKIDKKRTSRETEIIKYL